MVERQTRQDLKNEESFKTVLDTFCDEIIHVPASMSPFDYAIFHGGTLYAIGELKTRNVCHDTYDTWYIDFSKIVSGINQAKRIGVKYCVFFRFAECDRSFSFTLTSLERDRKHFSLSHYTSRGDKEDEDLVYHLDPEEATEITPGE